MPPKTEATVLLEFVDVEVLKSRLLSDVCVFVLGRTMLKRPAGGFTQVLKRAKPAAATPLDPDREKDEQPHAYLMDEESKEEETPPPQTMEQRSFGVRMPPQT